MDTVNYALCCIAGLQYHIHSTVIAEVELDLIIFLYCVVSDSYSYSRDQGRRKRIFLKMHKKNRKMVFKKAQIEIFNSLQLYKKDMITFKEQDSVRVRGGQKGKHL